MQYAKWYKSLYEMPLEHRPDVAVIEDDVELDRWYDSFIQTMARKSGKKGDPRYALGGDVTVPVPEFGG